MSRFYGSVIGAAETVATRRGHNDIRTAAQSYDGSVITKLNYSDNNLMVSIDTAEGSSAYGDKTRFYGTFDELKDVLRAGRIALKYAELMKNVKDNIESWDNQELIEELNKVLYRDLARVNLGVTIEYLYDNRDQIENYYKAE